MGPVLVGNLCMEELIFVSYFRKFRVGHVASGTVKVVWLLLEASIPRTADTLHGRARLTLTTGTEMLRQLCLR